MTRSFGRIGCRGLTLLLFAIGSMQAADRKTAPLEPQPSYTRETFGPKAGLNVVVHAGIGQVMGRPKEWGGGISGFVKRAGSGFATHIVKNSIEFPVAAMLHEDLCYHRSNDTSFGPRLRHSLVSTVWTPKTTTGNNTLSVGRISGAFGAGLISRLWQPASARGLAGGFASGGISLGAQAGMNVIREFWPRSRGSKPVPVPPGPR